MKTIIISLALLCLSTSGLVVAEPYADKVKITDSTTPMGQMIIKGSNVPDRTAVNIPPYPGAVIMQTADAGAMQLNGKDALPYIKMLTADDMDKVVAWYQDKLSSYYYQKQGFAGMFIHIFWKEKGDYQMFDVEARMLNENVGISDGAIHKDDYPQSKTVIEISYAGK